MEGLVLCRSTEAERSSREEMAKLVCLWHQVQLIWRGKKVNVFPSDANIHLNFTVRSRIITSCNGCYVMYETKIFNWERALPV